MSVSEDVLVGQESSCLNKDVSIPDLLGHLVGNPHTIRYCSNALEFSTKTTQIKFVFSRLITNNLRKILQESNFMCATGWVRYDIDESTCSHTKSFASAKILDPSTHPQPAFAFHNPFRGGYFRGIQVADYQLRPFRFLANFYLRRSSFGAISRGFGRDSGSFTAVSHFHQLLLHQVCLFGDSLRINRGRASQPPKMLSVDLHQMGLSLDGYERENSYTNSSDTNHCQRNIDPKSSLVITILGEGIDDPYIGLNVILACGLWG